MQAALGLGGARGCIGAHRLTADEPVCARQERCASGWNCGLSCSKLPTRSGCAHRERGNDEMKAVQLLIVGVAVFSTSFVAAGAPAPSPGLFHQRKPSSYDQRPAAPCLIGADRCSARDDPPMRACPLGAKGRGSCSTDGVKVIDAYAR